MKKAIFYKEWIKTRRYFPIALTVSVIFIIYALLGVQRVINFRGVAHLWEILLSRDVVFIETLTYIPLLAGLLLAIVQFVPEMQQKRLKLTLDLPYPQNRMLMLMLIAGLSELIVIYDDISFSPGNLRIRESGSAGGHNGVKSIIKCLNTQRFMRIKVGVGEKPKDWDLADFVLGRFTKEEREHLEGAMERAAEAVCYMVNGEVAKAMNEYNKKVTD